jgi:ubiquinone/menaquinone biosynthesis C-methylase UbiE
MKKTNRFDQAASQWDSNPTRVELARAIGGAILRAVPVQPQWRAVDYGAGTGLLTLNLQPHLASLLALDFSSGMLDTLAQKLKASGITNVATRQCNLEQAPLPETGFDLVVSSMTFHHLRDVPLVLRRLAALLKPAGWLAFADLDTEDGSFHGQADDVFHHGFDRARIAVWLQEAGFQTVTLQDAHTLKKPDAAGQLRSYGIFLACGQKAG